MTIETPPFTGRHQQLKDDFIAKRGYWSDFWDGLLALDADFFETYLRYSALPWQTGVLDPKVKEFVYIAIDVATTHLYELGLRIHIQNALRYGATAQEMLAVIKAVSGLGIHTATLGMPILARALERAGLRDGHPPFDARRQQAKQSFIDQLGYWQPHWDDVLAMHPDFFEVYLDLAASPYRAGGLEPKIIELMHIAACSSTTHLYAPALEAHIGRALALGASEAEIIEVFQLTSVLGMHSCTMGVPVLLDELAKAGQPLTALRREA